MEVVGVIAAIPGLVELAKGAAQTIHVLANQATYLKRTKELLDELGLIQQVLQDILRRFRTTSLSRHHAVQVSPALTALRNDLTSLTELLSTTADKTRGRHLVRRFQALASGIDKKLLLHCQSLERIKSSLTLALISQSEALAEDSLNISRSHLRLELQKVLNPCGHSFIPPRLEGTCEWIWKEPRFCQWVNPSSAPAIGLDKRFMCIYGPKGCGKSVLAKSIFEHLKTQGHVAILFSFWHGSDSQQKLQDLLKTFTWHLLQQLSDDDMAKVSTPFLKSLPVNETSLRHAIASAASLLDATVYCVIDGLDESSEEWSRPDRGTLKVVRQIAQDSPRLRLLFLGREPSIHAITTISSSSLEIMEGLVRDDIDELIASELDLSLQIQTPDVRSLVKTTLQETSGMMFLWIDLIFKELHRCQSPLEIKSALACIPHNLDREYQRIFLRLIQRSGSSPSKLSPSLVRTKRLLSLIIAAYEPLSCAELQHALACSESLDDNQEYHIIDSQSIINSCGDLVRLSDERLHIVHASAVEFLTRPENEWEAEDQAISAFRIHPSQAQKDMCLACCNYLRLSDAGYPLADHSFMDLPARLPFHAYAYKYLPWHAYRVFRNGENPLLECQLAKFIDSPQFFALVEYVLASLGAKGPVKTPIFQFMGRMALFVANLSNIPKKLSILADLEAMVLMNFLKELRRREEEFGREDARYQTLLSLRDARYQTLLSLRDARYQTLLSLRKAFPLEDWACTEDSKQEAFSDLGSNRHHDHIKESKEMATLSVPPILSGAHGMELQSNAHPLRVPKSVIEGIRTSPFERMPGVIAFVWAFLRLQVLFSWFLWAIDLLEYTLARPAVSTSER